MTVTHRSALSVRVLRSLRLSGSGDARVRVRHEATGIHFAARRRGGGWPLAARAQQTERMRRIGVLMSLAADDAEWQARFTAFVQGLQELGWTDRPQRADRHSLGRGDAAAQSQLRGGIGRACAGRHPGLWQYGHGAVATDDPHRADRVHAGWRSGRRRLRRKPGSAGRQRHRLHAVRIRHQREMAGAAQRDRAGPDARGRPSGPHLNRWDRPVRRDPIRGPVVRSGVAADQRARGRRDRARRRGIRALRERRPDRAGERVGDRFIAN